MTRIDLLALLSDDEQRYFSYIRRNVAATSGIVYDY